MFYVKALATRLTRVATVTKAGVYSVMLQPTVGKYRPIDAILYILPETEVPNTILHKNGYRFSFKGKEVVKIDRVALPAGYKISAKIDHIPQNWTEVAQGDGTTTTYTIRVTPVILDASLRVTYTIGGVTYTSNVDDRNGGITGTSLSGTVDYDRGIINLSFTQPPDSGTAIKVSYFVTSRLLVTVMGVEE